MSLAAHAGISAATRVELPARFLWRAYRQVLGRDAVPSTSPLDKLPLTWQLMQLLPRLLAEPGFEPLAGFLQQGDMSRRLQLAERLADLYDQYQVYRSDWLSAWAAGNDVLAPSDGAIDAKPIPPDQRWQPALWRELLAPSERRRPQRHPSATAPPLPRRPRIRRSTQGADPSASRPLRHHPRPHADPAGTRRTVAACPGPARHPQPLPLSLGRCHPGSRAAAHESPAPSASQRSRPGGRLAGGDARPRPSAAGGVGAPGSRFRAPARRLRRCARRAGALRGGQGRPVQRRAAARRFWSRSRRASATWCRWRSMRR